VVHGIVRDHGGAISVTSRVGEGSCFRLYFPAIDGEEEPVVTANLPPRGAGEHILLLDDELSVGVSMRLVLERLGYRVSSFASPLDALARFRAGPRDFDLVITDLTMPQMSGLEFAEQVLRAQADARVFLASGFSGGLTQEKVRALGLRGLFMKPFSYERLALELRRALES
jgi:CheY-like chemotaxis protein